MTDTKKIKRTALALFGIISVIFLVYLFQTARGIVNSIGHDHLLPHFSWNVSAIITTVIGVLIFSVSLAISLSLLFSIRKDETPFNRRTVGKLKVIAVLLIAFEVHNYIAQRIHPLVIFEDADTILSGVMPLGGFLLAAGLVVYCVSLILEYGISLQQQVDETL